MALLVSGSRPGDDHRSGATVGMWLLLGILVLLTVVVGLQDTRYALIPKQKTTELWVSVLATIGAVLVLRSGRWRGGEADAQRELGTVSNSYYEPRRRALIDGGAVLGGVLGGLWWGASTWAVLWRGMLRGTANRGLLDFEAAVVVGVMSGGVVGAVVGLCVGHVWETRHRRRRMQGPKREIVHS